MGHIAWFRKFENESVGSKATSINRLSEEGFSIPKGFVLTNEAYEEYVLSKNRNSNDDEIPENIVLGIETAYNSLNQHKLNDKLRAYDLLKHGENVEVAIRSDEETKLNVKGVKQVLNVIKEIYTKNNSKNQLYCPIIIQKMVKCSVSGEIYSDSEKIIIEACFGLGNNLKNIGADIYFLNRENDETKIIPASQTFAYYGGSGRVEEIELGIKKENERKLNNESMQKLKQIYINAEKKIGKNITLKFAIEDSEIFILSLFADNNYIEKAKPKFFEKIDSYDSKFENNFVNEIQGLNKLDQAEEQILNDMKEEFREKLNLEIIEPDKMSNADLYDTYREEIAKENEETNIEEKKMLEQIEENEKIEFAMNKSTFEENEKNNDDTDLYNYKEIESETSGEKLSAQNIGFNRVPKFEINEYIKNISGENAKIGDIREINELMHDIDEKIEKEEDVDNKIDDWEEEAKKEIEEENDKEDEAESKIKKFEDHNKDSLKIHSENNEESDDDFY